MNRRANSAGTVTRHAGGSSVEDYRLLVKPSEVSGHCRTSAVVYRDHVPEWDAAEYVYVQLANDLAARIGRGEFPAGTRLPSEAELASEYGVAKMTVRRALEVLRERGMVRTLHGRGSVVVRR
jgi:DNA-binding transcriptional ArsR family regulator